MERIQKLPEGRGSILGSLIRMEHQPIGGVYYHAQVMPFSASFDISNVAGPYKIRGFLGKVLLQMITAAGVLGRSGRNSGLVCGHFG